MWDNFFAFMRGGPVVQVMTPEWWDNSWNLIIAAVVVLLVIVREEIRGKR